MIKSRHAVAQRQQVLLPKEVVYHGQNQNHASISVICNLSGEELRAFDYFRQHAAFHLSGLFSCAVFNHLILQSSHQESTILRATVAVGALYQSRQTWDPTLKMSALAYRPHMLALSQYNRAIADLRIYIERLNGERSDAAVSIVLMACLLFVSFEMLQGNSGTVNAHLVKGLKLLSEHVGTRSIRSLHHRAATRTSTTQPDIDDLSEIFIRLDADSTMFRRRSPFIRSDTTKVTLETHIPSTFASVKEAKVHLDTLSSLVFEFRGDLLKLSEQLLLAAHGVPSDWTRHYCIAYAKARRLHPCRIPHMAHQRQTLLKALDRWSSSLVAIETDNRRAIIHLKIAKFLPYFLVSTLQDPSELLCDRFEDQFREIVDLAAEFTSTSPNSPFETYKFVPEAGILASLYIVGVKCRNPYIRRRAADLLLASKVQEGLWSGCIYGKCIKRLMDMEEGRTRVAFGQHKDEEVTYVPEEARFSDVIIDTGMDDLPPFGRIICARFTDEEGDELEVIEDVLY